MACIHSSKYRALQQFYSKHTPNSDLLLCSLYHYCHPKLIFIFGYFGLCPSTIFFIYHKVQFPWRNFSIPKREAVETTVLPNGHTADQVIETEYSLMWKLHETVTNGPCKCLMEKTNVLQSSCLLNTSHLVDFSFLIAQYLFHRFLQSFHTVLPF